MATITNFIEGSKEAPFILQCTVRKANASNLNTVKPDETTAILKVDEVFRAPAILGDLKGKLITAKLSKGSVKENQQFVLMARQWQYSSTIAIVETERLTSKIQRDDFRLQIINSHLDFLDMQLQNRISSADVIVSGKVTNVEKVKSKEFHKLEDKAEDWFEAKIFVTSLEKGKLGKIPEISVRFPGVESEKKYAIPKFKIDQEGVWLLHRTTTTNNKKGEKKETFFMAPDPLDFHLLNQLSRIRALLKRTSKI